MSQDGEFRTPRRRSRRPSPSTFGHPAGSGPGPSSDRTARFSLSVGRALGTVVVKVRGPLDVTRVPVLEPVLVDLIDGQGNVAVAVDLAAATVEDAEGVTPLLTAAERARARGTRLILHAPPPAIHRALEERGLADSVEIRAPGDHGPAVRATVSASTAAEIVGAASPPAWPGRARPLGANYDGVGTNFSVFSGAAERVELCLFDGAGVEHRVEVHEVDDDCWHAYVPGVGPGQHYGYRVHGPYRPEQGLRCDPAKLLLDPYATAVDGELRWNRALVAAPHTGGLDTGPFVPKGVVTESDFPWAGDRPPHIPWSQSLVYALHVGGFTARRTDLPLPLRGRFAGLAHQSSIDYLKSLGVTAVKLSPTCQFLETDDGGAGGGVPLAFFAPHAGYAVGGGAGGQVREFKAMVKALHEGGVEVICDVAFDCTAEDDELGPTLSFKGLDNAAYYRLVPHDEAYYAKAGGHDNSLKLASPWVLGLVMDALRYWVTELHVDGFCLDLGGLAVALPRHFGEPERLGVFQQDPVLSEVKLMTGPLGAWGDDGSSAGYVPAGWGEWNSRCPATVRRLWSGGEVNGDEVVDAIAPPAPGAGHGRRPRVSFNVLDEAEPSTTASGAFSDAVRLATLLVSAGVPVLAAGQELGLEWAGAGRVDWSGGTRSLLALTRRLGSRRSAAQFRWLVPCGSETSGNEVPGGEGRLVGALLLSDESGAGGQGRTPTLGLVINAGEEEAAFRLPPDEVDWHVVADTASDANQERNGDHGPYRGDDVIAVASHSLLVLEGVAGS